jgi:probable poly-beta-1,6-N-acetyl-D-glucosamine export protein
MRTRIVFFDYFRAIAIIMVVASHAYRPWLIDTFSEKVFINLVVGGTIFFVFISGFFFHYVFYAKFQYRKFLIKKFKIVFVPFAVLTTIGFIYFVIRFGKHQFDAISPNGETFTLIEHGAQLVKFLWTGLIMSPYWFVPTIMVMFVLSPLFMLLIKLSTRVQVILFIILLAISTVVHRPILDVTISHSLLSTIHSVLYYLPVYWLGILCSMHKETVFKFVENKAILIAILTVLFAALQVLIYDSFANSHKAEIFSYSHIDFMIIQKVLMCFFMLSVLQRIEKKTIAPLHYIAEATFAIYLLHPWVMHFLIEKNAFNPLYILPGIVVFILTTVIAIVLSLVVAHLVRLVFRTKSAHIIGW